MGFSLKKMFSGSGWRKFKGVASIGLSVIPGVGGVAGKLLATGAGKFAAKVVRTGQSTAQVLRASPVMPGGAVSTPGGMRAPMVTPPARYSGAGPKAHGTKRKKRKATSSPRRKGRKLKFGSKAWRAKYVKRRRR